MTLKKKVGVLEPFLSLGARSLSWLRSVECQVRSHPRDRPRPPEWLESWLPRRIISPLRPITFPTNENVYPIRELRARVGPDADEGTDPVESQFSHHSGPSTPQ